MKNSKHLPAAILSIILTIFFLTACAPPTNLHVDENATDKIAFESYRDGNAEVYVIDTDGENLTKLTDDPAYDGVPSWSADGKSLAFTSERTGNPDIYVMSAEGGDIVQLTDGQGAFNVAPDWSPDGLQILFVSNRTYKVKGDGGTLEVPANPKLWVMKADGSEPERLTSRLGFDMFGSWSPDGEAVAFMTVRDGNGEIYLKRGENSEANITNDPADETNPSFSPVGNRIAFASNRDGNMDIFVLDRDAGSLTNITNNPAGDGDPTWSPDGTQIAFASDRDGNLEIYIMDADGSNVRRITNDPADDTQPDWQPR